MTSEQYERWEEIAIRMARTCFRRSRRPTTAWIVGAVTDFLNDLRDTELIRNWDNSNNYPEGHPYYRAEQYQCGTRYAHPLPLCDIMSEWESDYINGDIYVLLNKRETQQREAARCRNDDEMCDRQDDEIADRFAGPVRCCVRAGLGMAVDGGSGMGVLGFTVGDIRRMYPEGVPEWIARRWDDAEVIAQKKVIPGVGFVPEVVGKSERFEKMADTAGLWL